MRAASGKRLTLTQAVSLGEFVWFPSDPCTSRETSVSTTHKIKSKLFGLTLRAFHTLVPMASPCLHPGALPHPAFWRSQAEHLHAGTCSVFSPPGTPFSTLHSGQACSALQARCRDHFPWDTVPGSCSAGCSLFCASLGAGVTVGSISFTKRHWGQASFFFVAPCPG